MRKLFIAALMAAGPAMADRSHESPGLAVRLTQDACTVAAANAMVKDEHRDRQRQGSVRIDDKTYAMCYVELDGRVWFVDEDGDMQMVPSDKFSTGA